MPWKLQKEESGYFVVKSDTGKRMNDKPLSENRAKKYLKALYANVHDVKEINTEISQSLGVSIKKLLPHEHKKKEVKANRFFVFKEKASGKYRWVSISSNSFRDLDGEIVSQKALENDVLRADKDKDYGVLRWWHVKGADLGACDYNAMVGKMLVESGTFFDERIAEKLLESADDFQISLGFYHPLDEPKDGVYAHIKRFERSILPKGKAANPYTSFAIN